MSATTKPDSPAPFASVTAAKRAIGGFRIGKRFSCSGPGWENNTLASTDRLFVEQHVGKCNCSYCQRCKWPVALWLPSNMGWNSWRVIAFRAWGSRWYVRWVLKQPEQQKDQAK